MKIKSLALQNFRCFGPTTTTINLEDLTGFVGSNGCGKSTVLQAVSRLFGITHAERTLNQGDFHIPRDRVLDEIDTVSLLIEARIEFPELEAGTDPGIAVPECFKQMIVDDPGATPYCRARLEGKWSRSNLPEGEIEQNLWWVKMPGEPVEDDHKLKMPAFDRSRIHVHYIPAARDPVKQIRQASGSIMHRLFRAVNWSEGIGENVEKSSDALTDSFRAEPGVEIIREALTALWQKLHPLPIYSEVHVRPLGRRFEDFLAQVETVFGPAPEGREHGVERLSDGLKSLFYLTLIGTIFDIERATPADVVPKEDEEDAVPHGISRERLDPPSLTVLAVEEPENHLAPHYLGRIMQVLRKVASSQSGQVMLTSHSPSIMARVEPEEVRYLRLDVETYGTLVRSINLPPEPSETHKFVREAVRAYPELYFARLVVLGEGDSEEIALPRIAECQGVPIDASFVSIVPLGGRHVNHFWRLLDGLGIPYVTLLDLDREREGGGWGRIKYVAEQLIEIGKPRDEVLEVVDTDGKKSVLSEDELCEMHKRDVKDVEEMENWIGFFECYGVFFSTPLDLDFLMQHSFPDAYRATAEDAHGPRIPKADAEDREAEIQDVVKAVLKKKGSDGATYSKDELFSFFWYRYLFLGRGKPTTHILALSSLTNEQVKAGCPKVFQRLVTKMKERLGLEAAAEAPNAD